MEAKSVGDLATWRRAKAVFGYIHGKSVIALSAELDVTRGSINRWLQWFQANGTDGLKTERERETGRSSSSQRRATRSTGDGDRGRSSTSWLHDGDVDRSDDRRLDQAPVRREVPQSSHSS